MLDKSDDVQKSKAPKEHFDNVEPAPAPPVGPDGGPAPHLQYGIAPPPPAPAATPETMVCLRGPCVHYWELHSHVDAGNPADTWDSDKGLKEALAVDDEGNVTYGDNIVKQPRQINRVCLVNPGYETELTGDCIYECNRWDPGDPSLDSERERLERRREAYYLSHPEHRPQEQVDGDDSTAS